MESITDELREYVTSDSLHYCSDYLAIANRIDQAALSARTAAYNDGYDAGFASADDWAAQHEDAMAEHGWMRLPVDADGVPIRVGDVMEWDNGTFTVHELKVTEDSWTTWDEQHGYTVHVDVCHHHAPTVEDVLREFTERVCDGLHTPKALDTQVIIAEYAAKLRLAGDDE